MRAVTVAFFPKVSSALVLDRFKRTLRIRRHTVWYRNEHAHHVLLWALTLSRFDAVDGTYPRLTFRSRADMDFLGGLEAP
jgi:hypothetical protein